MVSLRDFSTESEGPAVLLCAPFALHSATVADFAPGHSLIATLRSAGLKRLFLTDWRPACLDMRYLGISDYLAALNVLVDELGGLVDLIGLCQGGWMSMLYAVRFPAKVRKLVVAGAPIDVAAEQSNMSTLVNATPSALITEFIKLGKGIVLGRMVKDVWGLKTISPESIRQMLGTDEPLDSAKFAHLLSLFLAWNAWTTNLPGSYFREVVENLYRHNELATGNFVALGQKINLARVKAPLFMMAAQDDELVAPAQLFAAERLVGTPSGQLQKALVPGSHLGLFMGRPILKEYWPVIANWLLASPQNTA
ncbi:MAG TPA: alpha/beta fold hydrolase [Terriglobales bacterium]|nr:alpha/beta fold hydrolase [Terriglobales bacterium]